MKKLLLLTLAILLSLAACSAAHTVTVSALSAKTDSSTTVQTPSHSAPYGEEQSDEESLHPSQSPTGVVTPLPSASTFSSPSASPFFVPDTDIPDIANSINETVANSNYTLYEDSSYIYYLGCYGDNQNRLICINKTDGSFKQLTINCCISFTVNDGVFYYAESDKPENGKWNTIKSYNPKTGVIRLVKKLKYDIYSMACYKNKLYFAYDSKKTIEPYSDLYVCDLDGRGMKKIACDVYTFCIYKNTVYYTESSHVDYSPIDKINLDGSGQKELIKGADWYFYISNDMLFYDNGYIDLNNGESKDILYDEFAPFGKYIIYDDYYGSGNKETCYFHLYNTENGQMKDLTQISNIDIQFTYNLCATKNNVYYSIDNNDGSFDLYRLIIENGKASMELVAEYNPPAETPTPTPTATAAPEPTTSPPEPTASPLGTDTTDTAS